jgi:Flp pilus assembly protein TadD
VAALGLMLPALVLDTEGSRGAAADWDAAAAAGWPLAALGAWLAARGRAPGPVAWALPGVALAALLAAAQVNHRAELAEARFESLITHTFRTPRARSWGWETVASRRREAGDMAGAARAYEAALAEQPANVRLLRNTAGSLGRTGQSRRAADVLARLVAEVPSDGGAWQHLGMELAAVGSIDSAEAALRRAVELLPTSAEPRNELARLLLARPEARPEARALLARSLELAPTQPRAADLRRMVERLDRDGYGPAVQP